LCLVSHSKNSSMSNHTPAAKRDYYKPGKEDSLKQGLMMWETAEWTADSIKAHHQAMLNILREDLQKNV
ncbi:MAG: HNH endonuclease, partial [Alcaligenaceae bacterium]|nr:HNH endonuclease [Alcaligenaceae bacterium]